MDNGKPSRPADESRSWTSASRAEWGYRDDKPVTLEEVQVGALQRIALSLERLVELLDPEVQAKKTRERASQEATHSAWEAAGRLRNRVMTILSPFPSSKDREVAGRAASRIARNVGSMRHEPQQYASLANQLTHVIDLDWIAAYDFGPTKGRWRQRLLELIEAKRASQVESVP